MYICVHVYTYINRTYTVHPSDRLVKPVLQNTTTIAMHPVIYCTEAVVLKRDWSMTQPWRMCTVMLRRVHHAYALPSRLRRKVYFTTLGDGVRHAQSTPEEEGKEVNRSCG